MSETLGAKTPILMYHSIGECVPPGFARWVVTPSQFRRQLDHLAERHVKTVTVSELVRDRQKGAPPRQAVALTFDDGFADFVDNAMPILLEFGMTATLYIAPGLLGGEFQSLKTLDWGGVAAVRDAGFEIGGHSIQHPALDRLPAERAQDEISGCKQVLEDRLDIAVESFAYPFGFYNQKTRRAVMRAGYSSACAVGYDFSADDDDCFALRRVIVGQNDTCVDRVTHAAILYRFRSQCWRSMRQLTGWSNG